MIGLDSIEGFSLFHAILEMSWEFLFPLEFAVRFSFGFSLIGFLMDSALLDIVSGKSLGGSTEGLGSRRCKGTSD
jgi:hypothetical protein